MTQSNAMDGDIDVLVLAPFGKDSALIANVLASSDIKARVAGDPEKMVTAIPENAGVAIIAEEALPEQAIVRLAQKLEAQPPWSDFPIIVLTGGGLSTADTEVAVRSRARLGNVTLLERPLRAATMISAVKSAISARRRQYEIRNHLQERARAEEALRNARDILESVVEERTAALRRLSAQLLRVQDAERRRIARELHDSLGQYLAAIKMNVDIAALARGGADDGLGDIRQLIDQAIAETRTLSHLLHPPSLDTSGLASAATWYVEGFGKRSGIKTSLNIPENLNRLPESVETALFRIMQEALTNVHRHSGSGAVEITLTVNDTVATLVVRDFGKGIPQDVLQGFTNSGTNVGVGLAGIRERVKELGGGLDIRSSAAGTIVQAAIPISGACSAVVSVDPGPRIFSALVS